jgi:hypothetical protein
VVIDHSRAAAFTVAFCLYPNFADAAGAFNNIAGRWVAYKLLLKGRIGLVIQQLADALSEDMGFNKYHGQLCAADAPRAMLLGRVCCRSAGLGVLAQILIQCLAG